MSYISIVDEINNTSESINHNNPVTSNDSLMDNLDNESKDIVEKLLQEYREYSKKTDSLLDNFSIENVLVHTIEPSAPSIVTICAFFLSAGFLTYKVRKNNTHYVSLISSSSSDSISSVENIEVKNISSTENKPKGFLGNITKYFY